MTRAVSSRPAPRPAGHRVPRRMALGEIEIVATAQRIIKRDGVDGLTMRRLSDHLGVSLGATYKHVRNKDDLLRLVAIEIYGRIAQDDPADEDWQVRVRSLLIRFRDIVSDYPGMAAYISAHGGDIELLPLNQIAGEALHRAGFSAAGVRRVMRVLFFYTSGAMLTPMTVGRDQASAEFADGLDLVLDGLQRELDRELSTSA